MEQVEAWELGDGHTLLVHCSMGKSRSTAIALAIMVRAGMTPQAALARLKLMSPAMVPNRLMTEMFDEILGLDGVLVAALKAWYDDKVITHPGVALPNRGGYNR
jgi:predicted protein tyrosine phosphatase